MADVMAWDVVDGTGVVWDVFDGSVVVEWTVQRGPISLTVEGGGGGSPTGGAGGVLSDTYPNPGFNVEALQDAVGAMAGAGLVYDDADGSISAASVDQLGFLHLTNLDITQPHPFGGFLPPNARLIQLAGQTDPDENGTYRTPDDPATEPLVYADAADQVLTVVNSGTVATFAVVVAGASIRFGAFTLRVLVVGAGVSLAVQHGTQWFAQWRLNGDPGQGPASDPTDPTTISGASSGHLVLVTQSTDPSLDGLWIYQGAGQPMLRSGVYAPEGSIVFVMSEDERWTNTPHSGWIKSPLSGRVGTLELKALLLQNAALIEPDAWFVFDDDTDGDQAWSTEDMPEFADEPDIRALVFFERGTQGYAEIATRTFDGTGSEDSPEMYLNVPADDEPARLGLEYVGAGETTDETSAEAELDIEGLWAWVRTYPDLTGGRGTAQVAVPYSGDVITTDGKQWVTLLNTSIGAAGIDYELTEPWWIGLRFHGRIARVEFRDGIDGTLVAAPDAADHVSGLSFTDSESVEWTTTSGTVETSAVDLSSRVPTSRTLAGLDLSADRDAAALRSALGQGWQVIDSFTFTGAESSRTVNVTGYKRVRFTLSGRATRAATTENIRMTLNGNTGNVYGSNAAALAAFWALGVLPAATTNTDRGGLMTVELQLHSGLTKAGWSMNQQSIVSTSVVGSAVTTTGLFSTITAAVATLELFAQSAPFAAGSYLLVEAC